MKIQLLPSTFDMKGCATPEQRLTSFVIDNSVVIDAGSIAMALNDEQRNNIRDIIISHPHIDHVACLPIFIDDLFASLEEPVRVHATQEVIELLERDIFNWTVYPRFSQLKNDRCNVMEYVPFRVGEEFQVKHLRITAANVNHFVPCVGLVVSDAKATVAFTSDTAETEGFWETVNSVAPLDALFIEASFPNEFEKLAAASGHLTPLTLSRELLKLMSVPPDILVVHLKPSYRDRVISELEALKIKGLSVMMPGQIYEW
ncbi:MAG: MBL fold metallo-hydrolase [Pyrinomonadaceae bacterium]